MGVWEVVCTRARVCHYFIRAHVCAIACVRALLCNCFVRARVCTIFVRSHVCAIALYPRTCMPLLLCTRVRVYHYIVRAPVYATTALYACTCMPLHCTRARVCAITFFDERLDIMANWAVTGLGSGWQNWASTDIAHHRVFQHLSLYHHHDHLS